MNSCCTASGLLPNTCLRVSIARVRQPAGPSSARRNTGIGPDLAAFIGQVYRWRHVFRRVRRSGGDHGSVRSKAGGCAAARWHLQNNIMTMTVTAGLTGLTEICTLDAAAALNARGDALRDRPNALCMV